MIDGPLINGIPALGPGAKRIISWGQYGGLIKGIQEDAIEIAISFEADRKFMLLGPKKFRSKCLIDVKSFEGTDASDHNWDEKSAEALKQVATILEQASSGFKAIKIEIVEPKDKTNS